MTVMAHDPNRPCHDPDCDYCERWAEARAEAAAGRVSRIGGAA